MKTPEQVEKTVKETIEKYGLADKKEKIIVACSGGKDSTSTLHLLKKLGYNVEALFIDLLMGNYSKVNQENLSNFCKSIGVKLHIVNLREEHGTSMCYLREEIQHKIKLGNCAICGVIKRWLLNKKGRELKATKLATGHNLDDEVENVLMNFMNGNPELSINLGPKTGVVMDPKFVQRIKPMYFCSNAEIRNYSEKMKFPVLYEPCPCSSGTFRRDIRRHLVELEKKYPDIKENLIANFLRILPMIRKKYQSKREMGYCEVCGEPSNRKICKRCEFIGVFKKSSA